MGLQVAFIFALSVSVLLMKAVSVRLRSQSNVSIVFYLCPLPSIESWNNGLSSVQSDFSSILKGGFFSLVVLLSLRWAYWQIGWLASPVVATYFLVLPILFHGVFLSFVIQAIFFPSGKIISSHHLSPLQAQNVSEFWGKRWNTWFSDWAKQVFLRRFRRSPRLATFWVFLFSGIWHELVIDLPFYLFFKKNLFGMMLTYFLIQWIGVALDRIIFKGQSFYRRLFGWMVIVAPAPLFLNEATKRIFMLWSK